MTRMFALALVLYAGAAVAQGNPPPPAGPPTVGGRPLVQIKPRHNKMAAKPQSVAVKLQACLEIDDETKERLNCYDEIFPPKPKPKAMTAKAVADCRFTKEEDERLACFNGFAERIPKLPK
jgi:hypothetical protein